MDDLKIPPISKGLADFLLKDLSVDNQLTTGRLDDMPFAAHSESFKLGYLHGLSEASRLITFVRDRPDLKED